MKISMRARVISCLCCLLPILLGLYYYSELPAQIPIHWNSSGQIDGTMSKPIVIFLMPVVLCLINIFCFGAMSFDPKKANQSKKLLMVMAVIMPLLSCIVCIISIYTALGYDLPVTKIISMLVGFIFVLIGNYLPKNSQNYTAGFKLPWTLDNPDNWQKTNRLGGIVFVIVGAIFSSLLYLCQWQCMHDLQRQ